MTSRAESAAATGRALLDAASGLLGEGGPEAVTLRAVGARAGVSRGAPYGHFADKEDLLTALAIAGWAKLTADLEAIRADTAPSHRDRLHRAVLVFLAVGREEPHLYALMFTTPSRDPETLIGAASGAQDAFLAIVADVVGSDDARSRGALLMSSAHGIAGMESSGQLGEAKWGVTGDRLVEQLIALL
ncbi:TetR/AcrR family transcriptional regulator [Herbiconiux sp.]|uniref:TetR/AcrR family transcriptional regulator n=1 Tax=Herbiconiux sp. TaxID=1871186 RepID=UPI0025BAB615|nr:TetR/AcrR family transcriptional regulator [Herbiconiux sp.]